MTAALAHNYKLPNALVERIDRGLLKVLSENEAEKTVEFQVPALRTTDREGRVTTFEVVWIHPDFNAQFCHYFDKQPGDLPNFYVRQDTTDLGDELLEINTIDALVDWLDQS